MSSDVKAISRRVEKIRLDSRKRDEHMRKMAMVLTNRAGEVFKQWLPEDYPEPIVENTVRSAAEDLSYMIGVLPTLTAAGASSLEESKRSRSDKLTRIIGYHAYASSLGTRQQYAALQQVVFGFAVYRVEPDYKERRPHITVDNSLGCYWGKDRFGRMQVFFKTMQVRARDLAVTYPEHAGVLLRRDAWGNAASDEILDVVRYWDLESEVLFVPARKDLVLEVNENRLSSIPVRIAQSADADGDVHPSMNDSLWIMAAKSELALLNLEAANKAVTAPLAVPADVEMMEFGPDAVIRTNTPREVGRVGLDVPNSAIFEVSRLDEELKRSTKYPDVRAGQTDASVVTGRGVQALQGGFDARVKAYQSLLGEATADILSVALEADKVWFGNEPKKVYASVNGSSYELSYTPSKDIFATHVSAEYGVMAGLDPNRALLWSLQAMGAGLVSKRWVMENMPVSMNIVEQLRLLDVEGLRQASMVAMQSYAQAIPQLATQGQDPMEAIRRITAVIEDRKKGVEIEDAMSKAFTPQEQPQEAVPGAAQQPGSVADMMAQMGGGPAGGAMPQGAPNVETPYQPPSQQQLLTQLSDGGAPRNSVRTVRMRNI